MTQQIINVGTLPNDGTGDKFRNAFTKVNANFTEVYSGSFVNITATGSASLGNTVITQNNAATPALTISGSPALDNNLESLLWMGGGTVNNQPFETFLGVFPTFGHSGTVGEKAALWVQCGNTDDSGAVDIVGGEFKMFVGSPGQTGLRTWATAHEVVIQAGADGFCNAAEMSVSNNGVDQPLTGQTNSKYVLNLLSINNLTTAGIRMVGVTGGTFQYGIVGDVTAIEPTGYIINFEPNFKVNQAGDITANSLDVTGSVTAAEVIPTSRIILFNSAVGAPNQYMPFILCQGSDASSVSTIWGEYDCKIINATAGSKSSQMELWAWVANSEVLVAYFGPTIGLNYKTQMAASTTAAATLNIPVGPAPTSPVDGDVWREDNTNTGLKIRVNGVTKTITLS